jgi:hypothetical protein
MQTLAGPGAWARPFVEMPLAGQGSLHGIQPRLTGTRASAASSFVCSVAASRRRLVLIGQHSELGWLPRGSALVRPKVQPPLVQNWRATGAELKPECRR